MMLSAQEAYELINCADHKIQSLVARAGALRDRVKGKTITYSRKIFLPITNLCRDRCAYCTFRKDPDDPDAWTRYRHQTLPELRRRLEDHRRD
jgi:2-iminoacetate synthase ThiH